jgi:SAM-dependent methyltransferase
VPYADRLKVLAEVHRVLVPGGIFVVSCHNRDGPGHAEGLRLDLPFTLNPVRLGWRALKAARSLVLSLRNRRRFRALNHRFAEYSVMNAAAHDFGIVVLYTTLAEQKRQFAATGFSVEAVFDNRQGRLVGDDDDTSAIHWFHFVARKPPTA